MMAALESKLRRGLASIALHVRIGTVGQKQFGEIAAVGGGRGEDGGEPSGLDSVWRGAVLQEVANDHRILAQGNGGVERLVLLGIPTDCVDRGMGGEERRYGRGRGEG
jgi:hypothetical protein